MRNKVTKHNRRKIPFKKTIKEVGIKSLHSYYRDAAKKRGYEFSLSFEEFSSYIFKNCYYCGSSPKNIFKRSLKPGSKNIQDYFLYNGIDRKNNEIGYIIDNCVTCCKECNSMKMDRNIDEFLQLVSKIHNSKPSLITEKKLKYYHTRALATASASPDEQTKVGALLIHGESGAVIAEGYNGFIRGAPDDSLPKTRPEKYDYIIHAETNLICNAVRHGISTNNCVMFCTISPCIKCMRMICQTGIKEIYIKSFYTDYEQCSNMDDLKITVTNVGEFSKITLEPKRV